MTTYAEDGDALTGGRWVTGKDRIARWVPMTPAEIDEHDKQAER